MLPTSAHSWGTCREYGDDGLSLKAVATTRTVHSRLAQKLLRRVLRVARLGVGSLRSPQMPFLSTRVLRAVRQPGLPGQHDRTSALSLRCTRVHPRRHMGRHWAHTRGHAHTLALTPALPEASSRSQAPASASLRRLGHMPSAQAPGMKQTHLLPLLSPQPHGLRPPPRAWKAGPSWPRRACTRRATQAPGPARGPPAASTSGLLCPASPSAEAQGGDVISVCR